MTWEIFGNLLFLIIGFALLIKGADALVDGGASIAKKFKIPSIVVGLTIVSFGTSAPELLVSVVSAVRGDTDIALGNIVGSSISNILLILGVSAAIKTIKMKKGKVSDTIWRELPFTLFIVLVILAFGTQGLNSFSSLDLNGTTEVSSMGLGLGVILLLLFAGFMYLYTFQISKFENNDEEDIEELPMRQSIFFIITGLVGLGYGSDLATNNAVEIAGTLGVSTGLIGLTVVALGTSLPELAASATAAYKGNGDIAIGNVMGSNIFNLLLVLGTTLLFAKVPMSGVNIADMLMLFGVLLVLFALNFIFTRDELGKKEGWLMIGLYVAYTGFLIYRDVGM